MKTHLDCEAIDALSDTLNHASGIKLESIRTEWNGRMGKSLIARIEIYGHPHTLVCKVSASCDDVHLQRTFIELRRLHEDYRGAATPVLIAPEVSREFQTICRESDTGFLDLKGNARLYLEQVFIVKSSLPRLKTLQPRRRLPPAADRLPASETTRLSSIA
jgi:hypothetical protein